MSINTNIIIASSSFSGFMNTSAVSFQAGIGSQNIASGGYIGPARELMIYINRARRNGVINEKPLESLFLSIFLKLDQQLS